jgi:OOP family OmpA-OmpF porin
MITRPVHVGVSIVGAIAIGACSEAIAPVGRGGRTIEVEPVATASAAAPTASATTEPTPEPVRVEGDRVILGEPVQFAHDDAAILPASDGILAALARLLAERSDLGRVAVRGHASADGGPAKNLALSQARSESVVAALVARGVDGKRLLAEGQGDKYPVADNHTEAGRIANRRVELVVLERVTHP